MFAFIKKPFVVVLLVVTVGGIFGAYAYFGRSLSPEHDFILAKRANLVQQVSVIGAVKPTKSVDLAFEKAGRVTQADIEVGDFVSAGQTLVKLDSSELTAQLAKAEADLASNNADLEKAELVLNNYYRDVEDILNDAYSKASDAARKELDDLFIDDETNPQLTFTTSNVQNETDLEFQRLRITTELNQWLSGLKSIIDSTSRDALETLLQNGRTRLVIIRNLLDLAMKAVTEPSNLSTANINSYKTNINSGRVDVNAALSSINNQQQNIDVQKATIAAKSAGVKSYEANVQNVRAQLDKTTLYSPIAGVITKQDAKVGEIVGANTKIVSIISATEFDIEANVPEADIAKLRVGDPARITLDAYGDDVVFDAKVVAIDPAETTIEGVATYKTTLKFSHGDTRIKAGMTADIDILTAQRENVIFVPQRAVITRDGEKFVRIEIGEVEPEERKVETGLRGSYGDIEIISGIEEGEKVITFGGE